MERCVTQNSALHFNAASTCDPAELLYPSIRPWRGLAARGVRGSGKGAGGGGDRVTSAAKGVLKKRRG